MEVSLILPTYSEKQLAFFFFTLILFSHLKKKKKKKSEIRGQLTVYSHGK